jgi:cation transport regulator ChaC
LTAVRRRDRLRAPEGLWIFGYGSLVWRPAFPHRLRRPAWIPGFRRRFWQGSTDHRGVPGAPGRVVTLERDEGAGGARCWGMAYHVEARDVDGVLAGLDHREQGGYERFEARLHFQPATAGEADASGSADDPPCRALLYVATPENPNYLGPAPLDTIARQVLVSRGPSGDNVEYVLRLAETLLEIRPGLGPDEEDVLVLAERVRALVGRAGRGMGP